MPIIPNQLGIQTWWGGTLVYAHRQILPELYDITYNTEIEGYYNDGSIRTFKLIRKAGYDALDASNIKTSFLVDGKWMPIDNVIRLYSSVDAITIYTCYPVDGEVQGGLFMEIQ